MIFGRTWKDQDAKYLIEEISRITKVDLLNGDTTEISGDCSQIIPMVLGYCTIEGNPQYLVAARMIAESVMKNKDKFLIYQLEKHKKKEDSRNGESHLATFHYDGDDKNFSMALVLVGEHQYTLQIELSSESTR